MKRELDEHDIRSRPVKHSGDGVCARFSRGALYHLLSNRIYIGEIVHKDASYAGQHPPIIERDLFDKVAAMLVANGQERHNRKVTVARAPLTGLIVDGEGRSLCPVSSRNVRGRVYRYYVSAHLQQGSRKRDNDDGLRIPAPAVEALILERLRMAMPATSDWTAATASLVKVIIGDGELTILARANGRLTLRNLDDADRAFVLDDNLLRIVTPMRVVPWAGRTEILCPANRRARMRWCETPRPHPIGRWSNSRRGRAPPHPTFAVFAGSHSWRRTSSRRSSMAASRSRSTWND